MTPDNRLHLKASLGLVFLLFEAPIRWLELRWGYLRGTANTWFRAGIERRDPEQQYRLWAQVFLQPDDLERQIEALHRDPVALLDRLVRLLAYCWAVHELALRTDPTRRPHDHWFDDTKNALRLLQRFELASGSSAASTRRPSLLLEDGFLLADMNEASCEILRGLLDTPTADVVKALREWVNRDWSAGPQLAEVC